MSNGFTPEQKEILLSDRNIQSVGILSCAGYLKSTDEDDTINVGLLWCDDVYWEDQSAPAWSSMKGRYPQEVNELLVTREALKSCGKKSLGFCDSFSMTYEDNTGTHSEPGDSVEVPV